MLIGDEVAIGSGLRGAVDLGLHQQLGMSVAIQQVERVVWRFLQHETNLVISDIAGKRTGKKISRAANLLCARLQVSFHNKAIACKEDAVTI